MQRVFAVLFFLVGLFGELQGIHVLVKRSHVRLQQPLTFAVQLLHLLKDTGNLGLERGEFFTLRQVACHRGHGCPQCSGKGGGASSAWCRTGASRLLQKIPDGLIPYMTAHYPCASLD
ncbi:hypothetical protein D3C76_1361870 [compost metagenome]